MHYLDHMFCPPGEGGGKGGERLPHKKDGGCSSYVLGDVRVVLVSLGTF